tara:strand:+ start:369 stop:617 length:249 start_codon:yes stop_codon:yes gene_type:complete
MPTYDFQDKETGEVVTKIMSISSKEEFLKDNPNLKQVILSAPGIDYDGGKTVLGRAGDGWKEVQDRIKAGLPPSARGNIKTK